MKPFVAGIRVLLVLINTAFQMTLLYLDSLINGKTIERSFRHRRRWARWSMKIIGIQLDEVLGSFNGPAALIISNHRTLIDPVIQAAFIDAYIIAKAEVSKLPIISKGAQMTGIIFVKRERLRSRVAARETTKKVLLSGKSVLVYAEGTTGTNPTSNPFKPGTFAIAAAYSIPVVPVAIDYANKKDYWYDASLKAQIIGQIGAWKTHAKLRIGKPIYHSDANELLLRTKAAIDQDLCDMQNGWSNVFDTAESPV